MSDFRLCPEAEGPAASRRRIACRPALRRSTLRHLTLHHSTLRHAATFLALLGSAFLVAPGVKAQVHITAPLQPAGSARTLSMGAAVVANGGDTGALLYNPATLATLSPGTDDDLSVSFGARGTNYFVAHAFGIGKGTLPGAIWSAVLNGDGFQEQAINYSVGASSVDGFDIGASFRYERWHAVGDTTYRADGDIGLRWSQSKAVSFGLAGLNLLQPSVFDLLQEDREVIAGIGFTPDPRVSGEIDFIYTSDHKYARAGGELSLGKNAWLRGGVSDRDFAIGAAAGSARTQVSFGVDLVNSGHTLYTVGVSSRM